MCIRDRTYVCKLFEDHSLQCSGIDGSKEVSENLAGMTNLVAGKTQTCGLLKSQNVLCWDNSISKNSEIAAHSAKLNLAVNQSQRICELPAKNNLICWNQRE